MDNYLSLLLKNMDVCLHVTALIFGKLHFLFAIMALSVFLRESFNNVLSHLLTKKPTPNPLDL